MKEKIKQIMKQIKEKLRMLSDNGVNPVWTALCVVCIVAAVAGIIWNINERWKRQQAQDVYEKIVIEMQEETEDVESAAETTPVSREAAEAPDQETEEQTAEEEKAPIDPYEKKVNFSKLQTSVESNIYAWIYIPGTMVDYPILQHPTDNTYYLNHNLDGSKGYPGCIYTENYNSKDFTDQNTVIYGHNMKNGTMFGGMQSFRNKEYAEMHPYVYIYLTGKMYIYEIYAAYEHSDEHLLASQGAGNSTEAAAQSAADSNGYYKEGIEITGDSNIITLSTCISGKSEKRFLVQAVLADVVDR